MNVGEAAFPGIPTPLSWSWAWWPTEYGVRGCFASLGALARRQARPPVAIADRALVIQQGHVSLNLNLFRAMADAMPGTSGNDLERSLFGSVPENMHSAANVRRYPIVAVRMPVAALQSYRAMRAFVAPTHKWWTQTTQLSDIDVGAARELMVEAQRRYSIIARPHTTVGMVAQGLFGQLRSLCEHAGIGDVAGVLAPGGAEEAGWLTQLFDVAHGHGTLDAFVREHGYHGPLEGELSSPSWRMQPGPLEKLCGIYQTTDRESPHEIFERRNRERIAAERNLSAAIPRWQRPAARALLSLTRAFMPLRESGRATFLRAYDVARLAASVVGAELARTGAIESPRDVFYLTFDEVTRPVPPPDAREKIAARKELRARYERVQLPNLWEGDLLPADVVQERVATAGGVTGQGVSSGVAVGTVRVIVHPDNDADFEPGDILVCRATDPSWAPLFYLASAVVIDIGGEMSHGAIVARELGLPAVVNTGDGTLRLPSGSRVRVDGSAGLVTLL